MATPSSLYCQFLGISSYAHNPSYLCECTCLESMAYSSLQAANYVYILLSACPVRMLLKKLIHNGYTSPLYFTTVMILMFSRPSIPVLTQLRTFSHARPPTTLSIKDPNWPKLFDPVPELFSTKYRAPMSLAYKKKHKHTLGTLSWHSIELPNDRGIAWEATIGSTRTKPTFSMFCDQPHVHPFRFIPASSIKRTSSSVSIGSIIPVNADTCGLIDKLKDLRTVNMVEFQQLISDLYVEDRVRPTFTRHDLNTMLVFFNGYRCNYDLQHDSIRMMAYASVFRKLFEYRA